METKAQPAFLLEKKWLVIYTRPRWEKKVDLLLKQQGIDSYCPLRQIENQWADRKKMVSLPLFNSYVFVRVNLREESQVLYNMGVMGFVYYNQRPAVIRDGVIDEIKRNLTLYKDIEVVSTVEISVGDRIRIKEGVLKNQLGQVVQVHGKDVLMVFDNIHCALVTRIPFGQITKQNLD